MCIGIGKAGEHMTKREKAKREAVVRVMEASDGVAKTADLLAAGVNKKEISGFYEEGFIERVRHGYYQLAEEDVPEERIMATLLPEGIVSVESALYHYGYIDEFPLIWTVSVPRAISKTKVAAEALCLKPHYIPKEFYELGKTTGEFNGVRLAVYDRERTICDCLKYRKRLDREIFDKAIRGYAADGKKNLGNLSEYARKMGLSKRVDSLMEGILHG